MVTLECLVVGVGCEFTVEVSEDVAALRTNLHTAIVKDCNQQFDACALKLYVAKLGDKCLSSTAVQHLKRGKIPTFMTSIQTQGNLMNPSDPIDNQPRVKQHADRVDVLVVVPDNIKTLLRPISFRRKMQKYRGLADRALEFGLRLIGLAFNLCVVALPLPSIPLTWRLVLSILALHLIALSLLSFCGGFYYEVRRGELRRQLHGNNN